MNIFLISPVANSNKEIEEQIEQYIGKQKEEGNFVYYPLIHTTQNAPEISICNQNLQAIIDADEVHIYFQEDSGGSKFDLGMAFVLKKKIKLINQIEKSDKKSFGNLLLQIKD